MFLRQYLDEVKLFETIEELKAFVWKKCKPFITNQESFIKGQKLVNYQRLLEAIHGEPEQGRASR